MNKKELIEALKKYPDDTEIRVWKWTPSGSKYYLTNPTLTNNPVVRPEVFDMAIEREVSDLMKEMGREIEFKIKPIFPAKWEDTPIYQTIRVKSQAEAEEHAIKLSLEFQTEIRWNYSNYTQGHYVDVNR